MKRFWGAAICSLIAFMLVTMQRSAKAGPPSFVTVLAPVELPDPPGPVVSGKKGNVTAGDTLPYTITWGPGARATSYNVTLTVSTTNGTWSIVADSNSSGKWTTGNGVGALPQTANVTGTSLKTWVASIPWDSASFVVSVASKNAAGTSAAVSASWKVARKPGVPGPITVDSSLIVTGLLVKPDTNSIQLGTSRVVCNFFRFGNGAVTQMTAFKSSCDSIYTKYVPTAMRTLVKSAQQLQTDSIAKSCVTWSSSAPTLIGFTQLANCANGVTVTGLGVTRRFIADMMRYASLREARSHMGFYRCQQAGMFHAIGWVDGRKAYDVLARCPAPGWTVTIYPQPWAPTFLADR